MDPRSGMRPGTAVATVSLVLALLLVFGGASAQAAPTKRAARDAGPDSAGSNDVAREARNAYARGLALYDQGDYPAARAAFEHANAIAPSRTLLFNIALCKGQAGGCLEAVLDLDGYLAEAGDELDPTRRVNAETQLARFRACLASVEVTTNFPDVDVQIDDQPSGKSPGAPIPVNPGLRKIGAIHAGAYPASEEVNLKPGERAKVYLELREPPTSAAPSSPSAHRWKQLAARGLPLIGIVLLALVASTVSRRRKAVRVPLPIANPYMPVGGPQEETSDPTPGHVTTATEDPAADVEPQSRAPTLSVAYAAKTDVGKVKTSNEDSYLVREDDGLVIVADGVGGQAGGEVASATAVEVIGLFLKRRKVDVGRLTHLPRPAAELVCALYAANRAIREKAKADWNLADMSTTCIAARFYESGARLYIVHVGDSRAYRLRDGLLVQLTHDHTMAEVGMLGARGAHLSRALGSETCPKLDAHLAVPRRRDRYLFCSDGLSKTVPHERLAEVTRAAPTCRDAVDALVSMANDGGGPDNITAVVVEIG